MRLFLRMKHWQLFVLLVALPIFAMVLLFVITFISEDFLLFIIGYAAVMILFISFLFGWLYAVGTSLYKRLPETEKMNLGLFKFFLTIAVLYNLFISVVTFYFLMRVSSGTLTDPWSHLLLFTAVVLSQFLYIFCIFYCFYFVARTLKAVEWQKPVTLGDYILEIVLFWFYFVGVWFIQPRINKIFDTAESA